ncbi:MAG: serine--tRNA ligase [Bacteroidales bacterium]|nr:serine--tRNA ligase [Bacteroidales bacterium]MDT8430280.1 serine--tRNA ligase [Bacteroidales bacterium]
MLTLPYIREHRDEVLRLLKIRNFDATTFIDHLIEADNTRRDLQVKTNDLQAEMNKLSKEIGSLFKQGAHEQANEAKNRTAEIKATIKALSSQMQEASDRVNTLLVQIPNVPNELVPPGRSEEDNQMIREGGKKPRLDDKAMPHWDLAKKYDIIDFDLGVKLTGAGFPVYKGAGARLQRALISWFLEQNIAAGYTEILPPLMVNADSGFGTGQLPDKEGQMYHVQSDDFYLIPTAEVPVTNIYRDVILDAAMLPVKNTAYTPCFRREAGSYGKDVRGLNRVHQFDKVEIVQIQTPENSYAALDEMVDHVESLIRQLELPYRIVRLCGGDLGFTSALTYDFEVYAAAQDKWLEVSSVSNFESYQANRLKLRYKKEGEKKPVLAHTLNGSALALPRIVAALLENNQAENGIRVPGVLQQLMGTDLIR